MRALASHQVECNLSGTRKKQSSWVRSLGHQHSKINPSRSSLHVPDSISEHYLIGSGCHKFTPPVFLLRFYRQTERPEIISCNNETSRIHGRRHKKQVGYVHKVTRGKDGEVEREPVVAAVSIC